jgi:hypothetical protein
MRYNLFEPHDLFATRLPREFRDRAPPHTGIEASAGRSSAKVSSYTWDEILPGNYDGGGRVDAAVLFPSAAAQAWSMHDDPFGLAPMQTFSGRVFEDFCAPSSNRLIGPPMVAAPHAEAGRQGDPFPGLFRRALYRPALRSAEGRDRGGRRDLTVTTAPRAASIPPAC